MGNNEAYNPLQQIIDEGFLREFLSMLGFIHANDHCKRNCLHCPAYGDKARQSNMRFTELERIVKGVENELEKAKMQPTRSILSWRISDPLDYHVQEGNNRYSTYDVAHLWRTHFKQGLYLVTNGSEGDERARQAMASLVGSAHLLSQFKLTITPFDAMWGRSRYEEDIVQDLQILAPLWELPSDRIEDPDGLRLRINVKATSQTESDVRSFVSHILERLGYTAKALMDDRRKIRFKPIYDLGSYEGDSPVEGAIKLVSDSGERFKPTEMERDRYQYAIYPDLSVKLVDMYAFKVIPLQAANGQSLRVI